MKDNEREIVMMNETGKKLRKIVCVMRMGLIMRWWQDADGTHSPNRWWFNEMFFFFFGNVDKKKENNVEIYLTWKYFANIKWREIFKRQMTLDWLHEMCTNSTKTRWQWTDGATASHILFFFFYWLIYEIREASSNCILQLNRKVHESKYRNPVPELLHFSWNLT